MESVEIFLLYLNLDSLPPYFIILSQERFILLDGGTAVDDIVFPRYLYNLVTIV